MNRRVCERFSSLSLNCHGHDCNIDYCLCLCCFLRAPWECLSLLSCLSLFGEKCFAPLHSLVEQFAPHTTHVDDSNLNLSACIRMMVLVVICVTITAVARSLLCSLYCACLFVCV